MKNENDLVKCQSCYGWVWSYNHIWSCWLADIGKPCKYERKAEIKYDSWFKLAEEETIPSA